MRYARTVPYIEQCLFYVMLANLCCIWLVPIVLKVCPCRPRKSFPFRIVLYLMRNVRTVPYTEQWLFYVMLAHLCCRGLVPIVLKVCPCRPRNSFPARNVLYLMRYVPKVPYNEHFLFYIMLANLCCIWPVLKYWKYAHAVAATRFPQGMFCTWCVMYLRFLTPTIFCSMSC